MIIEADITNPATAGWTQPWNATSYDNKEIDTTKIIDGLPSVTNFATYPNAGGRTWVGAVGTPNLWRVYTNTETFFERVAK